jgi:hypothetical protein
MPPKDQIINEDFELPEHLIERGEETVVERRQAKPEPDFEIEVLDDTPPEDQNRKPLTETEQEEQEEELENYSEKVKKRINQMSHKYHDERRAKEQAAREREEALKYAQTVYAENQRLMETLSWGQQEFAKMDMARLDAEQQRAEDKYRKAYEAGDTEGTLAAQREIANLAVQRDRAQTMAVQQAQQFQRQVPETQVQPQALQQPNPAVYNPQTQPERTPDPRAQDWAAKNPWFGKDDEMTSLAYGIHQRLVNEGVDVTSDEYYAQIDSGMRQRFPEKFERPKRQTTVAPVGRTTATKKVTLTASQVAIAKRLGVPLEVYAKHALMGNKVNG